MQQKSKQFSIKQCGSLSKNRSGSIYNRLLGDSIAKLSTSSVFKPNKVQQHQSLKSFKLDVAELKQMVQSPLSQREVYFRLSTNKQKPAYTEQQLTFKNGDVQYMDDIQTQLGSDQLKSKQQIRTLIGLMFPRGRLTNQDNKLKQLTKDLEDVHRETQQFLIQNQLMAPDIPNKKLRVISIQEQKKKTKQYLFLPPLSQGCFKKVK